MDRNFEISKKVPELFNDPKDITLKRGEQLRTVLIEITPEGTYNENGEYQDPQNAIFPIVGFDRSNGREFWLGRAYVIETEI